MDPSNLLAHKLRKMVAEGSSQEQLGEAIERLLELDRLAHVSRDQREASDDSVIALNHMRALS